MLIRVDGRHDGVKEYLEHGRKQDREFSRDELDERVVLAGDLELADAISKSIDVTPDVDRYLSITLSFREDEVDRETLQAITREFEDFVFAAYRRDEYCFYAEAHLPRIKSYIDRRTGQLVERKPHIHIVLPKLNLISGMRLEPLGYVKSNLDYIDAFQEHINAKYGLASPKDHRRVQITDASEMVSRYRGDLFGQARRDVKEKLLDAVLDRSIERYEDFLTLVAEHGDVRIRNAGRENAYPNVRPEGDAKGINLKEFVFSREFIELPTATKKERLAADVTPRYEIAGPGRAPSEHVRSRLDDWHAWRAREVKYINNGPALDAHRQAGPDDQRRALDALERGFYAQHLREHHEPGTGQWRTGQQRSGTAGHAGIRSDGGLSRRERVLRRPGRVYGFKPSTGGLGQRSSGPDAGTGGRSGSGDRRADRASWRGEPDGAADRTIAQTRSVDDLRSLSGVPVVPVAGAATVLLPDHARNHLEHRRAERAPALRRTGDRKPGSVAQAKRQPDTRLEQLEHDYNERAQRTGTGDPAADLAGYAAIRQVLDANRLLAELSHSHGVMPQKYRTFRTKGGAWRIRAGTRNLNVSDFLTKELNLPWRDAAQILRDVHAQQCRGEPVRAIRERPGTRLWRAYTAAREADNAARRKAWDAQRSSERDRREALRTAFLGTKATIDADPSLDRPGKRAALSVARMARVACEAGLAAAIRTERAALRVPATGASYSAFLQRQAEAGDAEAQVELRRSAERRRRPAADWNMIRPAAVIAAAAERNEIAFALPSFTWSVRSNGDVVYRRDDVDVLRDEGGAVQVMVLDSAAIEAGLRLAQGRFGRVLELEGSEAYRQAAARTAAEAGIYVEFTEPALNEVMRARRQDLVDRHRAGSPADPSPDRGEVPGAAPPAPDTSRKGPVR